MEEQTKIGLDIYITHRECVISIFGREYARYTSQVPSEPSIKNERYYRLWEIALDEWVNRCASNINAMFHNCSVEYNIYSDVGLGIDDRLIQLL